MNKQDIKNVEKKNMVSLINQSGVEEGIKRVIEQNRSLLPQNVAVERIINSGGFYVSHRTDLMELGNAGKLDMLYNILKEAMVGLEAGTDFDIIPFKGKPVVCRKKEGWYKIIDLIKPAEIIKFTNNVVLKGDEISFNPVTEELIHVPKTTSNKYDDILGAYAYIKFANGFEKTIYMTRVEIDAIKRVSPSANSSFSPWVTMPLKMVKTKVVKELAKELNTLFGGRVNELLSKAINIDETNVKEVDNKGFITVDNEIYDAECEEKTTENESLSIQKEEQEKKEVKGQKITLDEIGE